MLTHDLREIAEEVENSESMPHLEISLRTPDAVFTLMTNAIMELNVALNLLEGLDNAILDRRPPTASGGRKIGAQGTSGSRFLINEF